ncbi:MAG TPA: hypothetical protein VH541_05710 [Gaiellaceae bacterium]|jgi:hypothetical protein
MPATTVTLLNHAIVGGFIASVHRTGCRDIARESLAHASKSYGPYATASDAIEDYLDEEMREMGYHEGDIKVHACCR